MPNVMVVTDDVWVENEVRAALTDADTAITVVADPRLVVEEATRIGPDLTIIDLQVGSMGGMAVIRALRSAMAADEIDRARTVLLLDRSADTFLARRAGADAWVIKPFTAQELRAVVAPPAKV